MRSLYKEERDPLLRPRWQALWRLRRGETSERAAELVGVHGRTVLEWVRWYREGGLDEVRRHRRGGRGRDAFLTPAQQQGVHDEVAQGRFKTCAQIGAWVQRQFGVQYTRGGMYTLLGRLEARPKVPRPHSTKADDKAQAEWKRRRSTARAGPGPSASQHPRGVRR